MNKEKIVEIICEAICDSHGYNDALGMANCVFDRLEKSGFLLKSAHGSNHKDFAHCANTRLGDSAASVETSTVEEPAGEILSETASVRQNEVAKKALLAFIKEVETEFKDQDWQYLYFIMDRVLAKQVKPIDTARRE